MKRRCDLLCREFLFAATKMGQAPITTIGRQLLVSGVWISTLALRLECHLEPVNGKSDRTVAVGAPEGKMLRECGFRIEQSRGHSTELWRPSVHGHLSKEEIIDEMQKHGPMFRARIAARMPNRYRSLFDVDDVMQETHAQAFLGYREAGLIPPLAKSQHIVTNTRELSCQNEIIAATKIFDYLAIGS